MAWAGAESTAQPDADGLYPVPDRRSAQRMMTTLRIGKMICGGVEELCLIRNISEGGLMLRVYAPRRVGERVSIELKSDHSVTGEIIWVSGDHASAGVRFDQPIDVNEVLRNERPSDGRRARAPRVATQSRAKLRIDGDFHLTELCDLSQGGAKILFGEPIGRDQEVTLTIVGLRPQKCVIRWQALGHTGLSFVAPLPLSELIEWLNAGRARAA